jgi:hypothetical protein
VVLSRLTAVLMCMAATASAKEIAGVHADDHAQVGAHELVLNGAGLHRTLFSKIYVAALYLVEKQTSPAGVLALAGPKRISITLLRDLPAQRLVDSLMDGIHDNTSREERPQLKDRLDELTAILMSVGRGKRGDVIAFDFLPDTGTVVLLDGEAKGAAIPGEDLYRALLRVWVGGHPGDGGLKKALLDRADGD